MEWAKFLNDDLGFTVNKFKDRMTCFGTLPMQCPEEAVKEMKRCVLDLIMRGFLNRFAHQRLQFQNCCREYNAF
jgi:aminocarboxymuconate-semialdehyde decarboxylase